MSEPLSGIRIAVPETRQLDILTRLLEARGASVLPVPLVAIVDAPDAQPINDWLDQACDQGFDDLIFLTGEGVRRLLEQAGRRDQRQQFLAALAAARKLTRGPKPAAALRELGMRPELQADDPTTDGVIETLRSQELSGRRIGVQLYGEEPNQILIDFLTAAGAQAFPVAPYRYADREATSRVESLIGELADGSLNAITFTSSPQVRRLFQVARDSGRQDELQQGLARTLVAAVGPVVAEALNKNGVSVDLMPDGNWFMKPLVKALVSRYGGSD